MERFGLDEKLREELRARVLGEGFMKLVQSVRRNGRTFRISVRPVEIGGEKKFQAEMVDDGTVRVKNFDANGIVPGLEEILDQRGARDLHLMTATGDVHVRVTKKGRAHVSRSAEMARVAVVQPHDRVKNVPLTAFDSSALLRTVGIADGEGRVRASMRGKYDQVNEFLKMVGDTLPAQAAADRPFVAVDCGCGKAYLTLALYFYLTRVRQYPDVRIVGIDRRADVVATARAMAERLDVGDRVVFREADLADVRTPDELFPGATRVDLVVSLHACDTATDEALAKGVEWKAGFILSAPCCQHELQKTIGTSRAARGTGAFAGLLRQSILRERLCDLLTDAFRAQILRILGFKVQVVEFVSGEATARNVMLRCEWGVKPGQPGPAGEYLELRDFWQVVPWLETRLADRLGPHLARYA
jgi:hypothetical protein